MDDINDYRPCEGAGMKKACVVSYKKRDYINQKFRELAKRAGLTGTNSFMQFSISFPLRNTHRFPKK